MWIIKIENKTTNKLIKNTFKTKQEAFKYIKNNMIEYQGSDISLINGDIDLISENIKKESTLEIKNNDTITYYGIIDEISDYLVIVKKPDGSFAEFTKSRINKEYIDGRFKITA